MKKIISILLALAVVFSFAACENGVVFPENAEKTVLSVTLESAPEYLVGETVDPADVTLRVVYGDRTEDTFTGAELGLTATSYKLTDVKNTFTVKFGAPVAGDGGTATIKSWNITIPAYKLTKLVVDPTEAVKTVAKDAQTISTTGLAFTGTYNGNQTKSVSYDVAKESFENLAFTVDTSVEKEDVKVAVAADNEGVTISPEWYVDVVEATNPNAAVNVTLKQIVEEADGDGSNEVFRGGDDTLADIKFVAIVTPAEGEDVTVTLTENTDKTGFTGSYKYTPAGDGASEVTETVDVIWNDFVNTKELTANAPTSFTATVTVKGADDVYYTDNAATLPVEYAEDYPLTYNIQLKDDKTTFKAGSEITNNFFEFRAMSWASGKSVTDSTNGDVISNGSSMFEIPLAQRYVKSPVATSETQEISFTYIGKGNQIVSAAGNSITSVSVEAAK